MRLRIDNPPPGAPARFEPPGDTFTFGRGREADWRLPDPSRSLSSVHCEFRLMGTRYAVVDRSRNGTTVNGAPLPPAVPHPLQPGDRVLAGPFTIVAEGADEPAASPSPPVAVQPFGADPLAALAHGAGLGADAFHALSEEAALEEAGRVLAAAFAAAARMDRAREAMRAATGTGTGTGTGTEGGPEEALPDLASALARGEPLADGVEASLDRFLHHDRAMFAAMQTALFGLLNELAPDAIEREAPGGRRAWAAYRARWMALVEAGEHGVLDAFMARFREAYDDETA